jgi:hypothetical protein
MCGNDLFEADGGLFAWTTIGTEITGLKGYMWAVVGDICAVAIPVVVFTMDFRPDCFEKCLIVNIETMEILCSTDQSDNQISRIMQWIYLNQQILMNHWNSLPGFGSSNALIANIIKINEREDQCQK